MKKFIIILFLFHFTISSFAQSTLIGKILNSATSEEISYANVTLNKSIGTTSNEKGIFKFENLKPGNYILNISFIGFESLTQKIKIEENKTLELDFKLQPGIYSTDDIVITATKTENYIQDIPTRINLLTPRQIQGITAQTTDELLSNIPGITITRSFGIFSHKSSVTMRGLSGQEQARILVLIDGVPTNKSDGGSVNWNLLNTDMIERIEVIKGPGSSLYGSNAMGGAINIITKKPTEQFSGKFSVDYGTYNTMRGRINLSGRLSETTNKGFYWNLNSFYRQSDGYITQSEADQQVNPYIVNSTLQEWSASAKLGYDFNKTNGFELDFIYYDDKRETGEKVYQPDGNKTDHDTYHIRARYFGESKKLKYNISLFYLNENYKKVNEYLKDDYTFYDVLSVREDLGVLSSVSYSLNKNTITAGIDYKQGVVDAKDVYYTSTDIVYNRGKMNFFGLFAQDEISLLNDRLKVIAGLRFDYAKYLDGSFEIENPTGETTFMMDFEDTDMQEDAWNALSPKLSAQYNFNPDFRIYANYAKGFRPSILDDLCRSGRMKGGFKLANPSLQPEYLSNFEIGTDIRLFNKLRSSASLYYSLGTDFMYYVNTGDSIDMGYGLKPIYKRANISEVNIYGAEVELNYFLNENLIMNANYAYTHSQISNYKPLSEGDPIDLTDKYLTDVPTNMVSLSVLWKNRIVNTALTAKYTDEMWVNDLNQYDDIVLDDQYPAYTTVDLKFSKDFKRIFANLSIQNILDTKFYDSKGAVCPGRFITIELGTKF